MIIAIVRYCDGWILVDRAGSWTAVLLHVYSHVCVCMSLFASSEKAIDDLGERMDEQAVAQRTIVFRRRSSSRHRQMCVLMARQISSLLGTPWSQVAAVATSVQQWSSCPEGSKDFGSHDTIPERGKARGEVLVHSPLWGAKAVGLPLVDKVDSKHRKSTHEEGAEMQVYFFKGMKGRGKVVDFSTAGEGALETRSHSSQETGLLPVASIFQRMRRRD